MKNNNAKLKIGSSILVFLFLLIIKNYFYYTLKVNLNRLSDNFNLILNLLYIFTSLGISILFYDSLNKKKDVKKFLNSFFRGIGAVSAYFILNELEVLPILLSGADYESIPIIIKAIYLLSYEIVMLYIIYLILKEQIHSAIKDIKKNHAKYFKTYFKYWIYALIIMTTSNLIINLIHNGSIPGNEVAVRNMFSKAPIYTFISAVFIAPLLEEFIFRQGIRNIFSNSIVFIIASGLIFGGLHVVGNVNSAFDLLYLIPYCTPGFIFAYILSKTDNVFVSAGIHFLHNGIIMSLQILLIILGQM